MLRGAINTILILSVLILSAVGYVFYRYANTPEADEVAYITRISGFSPSICTAGTNSFEGVVSSKLYVAHGKMRIDKRFIRAESTIDFHDILTSENNGTSHSWFDRISNEGFITTNMFGTGQEQFGGESFECKPWWFVDESVFQIPSRIIFPESEE